MGQPQFTVNYDAMMDAHEHDAGRVDTVEMRE